MGEVVGAGLLSHVPTIMLPEEVRLEINDGKEISLVTGLRRIRSEVLDRLRPDTVVVMDTHWEVTFEHVITAHERRTGKFTSGELPRGMRQVPYDFPGDPELAAAVAKEAENRDDTWVLASDDPYLPIFYGTVNVWSYLNGGERWVSIGINQTGQTDDYRVRSARRGAREDLWWPSGSCRYCSCSPNGRALHGRQTRCSSGTGNCRCPGCRRARVGAPPIRQPSNGHRLDPGVQEARA